MRVTGNWRTHLVGLRAHALVVALAALATLVFTSAAYAQGQTVPPAAPSDITATLLPPTSIRLTWVDNSTNETGFRLEYSVNGGEFVAYPNLTIPPDADFATLTRLQPGNTYEFRLRAINAAGQSGFIETEPIRIPTAPGIPAAPTNLVATLDGPNQARITWEDNSNNEAGFLLQVSVNGGTFQAIPGLTLQPDTEEATVFPLQSGFTYDFRIRAFSNSGNSAFSNVDRVTVSQTPGIPAAPTNAVAVRLTANEGRLSWTDNSANEDGFKIEYGTPGQAFRQFATVGRGVDSVPLYDLRPNVVYLFRIRAFNQDGNSGYTNVARLGGTGIGPNAPRRLRARA
ncbi:MAG TPA: fibronectin type III domain-containing protein, partial [Armatimonadota bacterium]|nr:fibronectin type III domain-containing protein [Armatimonadota bacterium]